MPVPDFIWILYGEEKIPEEWVFNYFGHITCYYYKDLNDNKEYDKPEKIHTEFIHPTPKTEALTKLKKPISIEDLGLSHGCVHVKPKDIDEMIEKGYLKKGNKFKVHSYKERVSDLGLDCAPSGKPPYEVHFFPRENAIVIVGEGEK